MAVDLGLDGDQLFAAQRGVVAEIKAQPVGGDERPLLRDVAAEPLAKGRVEQVRRRMIGAELGATAGIDREDDGVADGDPPGGDLAKMDMELAELLCGVGNGERQPGRGHRSGVARLPARFAVERGLVGDDGDGFARIGRPDADAVADKRDDRALTVVARIPGELGRAGRFEDVEPHRGGRALTRARPCRARRAALLGHRRVEAGSVDADAAVAERILGQVVGKAEGVVELERDFAW